MMSDAKDIHGLISKFIIIYGGTCLKIILSLHVRIYMIFCVDFMHMKKNKNKFACDFNCGRLLPKYSKITVLKSLFATISVHLPVQIFRCSGTHAHVYA